MERTNLVTEASRFIGRRRELAALEAMLEAPGARVTLVGAAGIGKTRLALRHAGRQVEAYQRHGGVWLCDVGRAGTIEELVETIAQALGLTLGTAGDLDDAGLLERVLAGRRPTLLVLDHVADGAPWLSLLDRWRARAPEVRVLATARAPLKVADEFWLEVGPLAEAEAEELLLTRVGELVDGWTLPEDHRGAAREIVRRLEQVPLAIELLAARAPDHPLPALLAQLERAPRARREAAPGALRHAIEWADGELPAAEADALAQCSIFAGGMSLEDAEAVLDLGAHPGPPRVRRVLDALSRRALLRGLRTPPPLAGVRFGLDDSIQQYAAEKLRRGGRAEAEARHAAHFVARGEEHAREHLGPDRPLHLAWLELASPNLVAVQRRRRAADPAVAARVVLALDPLLSSRGPYGARQVLLDLALEAARRVGDAALLSRVLAARGDNLHLVGRFEASEPDLLEALRCARGSGDPLLEAEARRTLGVMRREQGRFDEAAAHLDHALLLAQGAGDRLLEGLVLGNLGSLHRHRGTHAEARAFYERALAIHREVGNRRSEGVVLGNLGHLEAARGALAEACTRYQRALELVRELWDPRSEGILLGHLGHALSRQGALGDALSSYERAVDVLRQVGDGPREQEFRAHADALRARLGVG